VFSGFLIDTKDAQVLDNFLTHGVRHGYRAQNLSQRYKRIRHRYGNQSTDPTPVLNMLVTCYLESRERHPAGPSSEVSHITSSGNQRRRKSINQSQKRPRSIRTESSVRSSPNPTPLRQRYVFVTC
jgi:hypothetical protein